MTIHHQTNTALISVQSEGKRSKLNFSGQWLGDIGFTPGMSIQHSSEPGGITFKLAEPGMIGSHQVSLYRNAPRIYLSGRPLLEAGLQTGDSLIALYKFGAIHLRKLPDGPVKVTASRISGVWLGALGFLPDAVFTVHSQPGLITCQLHENARDRTLELVKLARAEKLKLLQVQKNTRYHFFDIPLISLEKAGFSPEDLFLTAYGYGRLKLQKLDFVGLGFC